MKKITKATLKSFVNKNRDNLYIRVDTKFDGMVDCVMETRSINMEKVKSRSDYIDHTLGISGVWLVGRSRDYFSQYTDGLYEGIRVYNCCGSFILAVKNQS
jgi:hypothetical protein